MTTPGTGSAAPQPTPRLRVPDVSPAHRQAIVELRAAISGDVRDDAVHRVLYATDASIYEVIPVAVAMPRTTDDLQQIVQICGAHELQLTVRTAGTSLAGQAVGPGLVVDCSRYMNRIGPVDVEARTIRVQPGVVRDDLNAMLKPHGLMFGPDTSTSNRCMIGGMIGNNSCGSHSVMYGQTRDHLKSIEVITADGAVHEVGSYEHVAWQDLLEGPYLLNRAAKKLDELVRGNGDAIRDSFPKPEVRRRNTGYPLDDLANTWLGHNPDRSPNLARFLCGSEGTLALVGEATLNLVPTPAKAMLIAAHFESIEAALYATIEAVKHNPSAAELMDKRILDLAKLNREALKNRWFVEGDPGAILVVELVGDTVAELEQRCGSLINAWQSQALGYHYPIISGAKMPSVWQLRKDGLGVLFGKPGDLKPATLVEDTAVAVDDLPAYIRGFEAVMAKHGADCVYYAHASVGELHMRPELNLKVQADIDRAVAIASDIADLVKEFRGSLSGEHGDGRLRGPFIERALGSDAYAWLVEVKRAFDPNGLLNPHNIVDAKPMTEDWRFHKTYRDVSIPTEFAYEAEQGIQRAVEMCNGTGVCRRTSGGTMCPSYQATLEERESTRGRANLFRVLIQQGPEDLYGSSELYDALDLCLACKGCKNDCPSSVDMARFKAEFHQGWHDRNGVKFASRAFANTTQWTKPLQLIPGLARAANAIQSFGWTHKRITKALGIHDKRPLPKFAPKSFHRLHNHLSGDVAAAGRQLEGETLGTVCLVVDEFTDRYDVEIGLAAVKLLQAGGYRVIAPKLGPSGRTYLSKGFVREARKHIEANVRALHPLLGTVDAFVGVEPSAIFTLSDEALDLPTDNRVREQAGELAQKVMLVEQFVANAAAAGKWRSSWTEDRAKVLVHGHCHQKALASVQSTIDALSLPPNYEVSEIPSGCCGMAGSFGYEANHYELSMQIGELVLFPAVRKAAQETLIAAPGHSCRHQISDGTGRVAQHPVQILLNAVR